MKALSSVLFHFTGSNDGKLLEGDQQLSPSARPDMHRVFA
jgi:hypothetical protein